MTRKKILVEMTRKKYSKYIMSKNWTFILKIIGQKMLKKKKVKILYN